MWNQLEKRADRFGYSEYKLTFKAEPHREVTILVGPRPDAHGCTKEFYDSIEGWISVTARFIEYPPGAEMRWFPWPENKHCPPEVFFSVSKQLLHWLSAGKSRIYIHCDAGTHRAPTVLGAFLKYNRYVDFVSLRPENREHISDAREYIDAHLMAFPGDHMLLKYVNLVIEKDLESIYTRMGHEMNERYLKGTRF